MSLPSADFLWGLFSYDPFTGKLYWAIRSGRAIIGAEAGSHHAKGYLQVNHQKIGGPKLVHRVVWKMITGENADGHIDHKDGNKTNNIFTNLRVVNTLTNAENVILPTAVSTTGLRGVSFHKPTGKWRASIRIGGRNTHLGLFTSPEAASEAYILAKIKHHAGVSNEHLRTLAAKVRGTL